jgi:hypothetical protein
MPVFETYRWRPTRLSGSARMVFPCDRSRTILPTQLWVRILGLRTAANASLSPRKSACLILSGRIILGTMTRAPHIVIHCVNCGLPTLLQAGKLQKPFADQDKLPNNTFSIGLACPHCKHLHNYSFPQESNRSALGPAFVADIPDRVTGHVRTLSCGEPDCESRLPIFAQWNEAITEEGIIADVSTWPWENLVCPKGHKILKPAGW